MADYVEDANGNGNQDGSETSLVLADSDDDSLTDFFEIFASLSNPTNPDTDGNGTTDGLEDHDSDVLTNIEEQQYGSNPWKNDTDGDALSDWAEINVYGSNPANPVTFNPAGGFPNDGEFLFAAQGFMGQGTCPCKTDAHLHITDLGGGLLGFEILMAPAAATYDLYFVNDVIAQRWQWRRVRGGIRCDATGAAAFKLQKPDPVQGYFVILDAADRDGDGLSNGYECWVTYSGEPTVMDIPDSDDDQMFDGWEAAYGINPTPTGGANDDADGDPDDDDLFNVDEHDSQFQTANNQFTAPSYDPLKFNTPQQGQNARPVVSIFTTSSNAVSPGGNATFTIRRAVGQGASLEQTLKVYFSVGGTAEYATDYSLSESQSDYPRILSATIAADQTDKIVTVIPGASRVKQAGAQTIIVKLTPYGVTPASLPSTDTPSSWSYVVDVHHQAVTLNIHNGILINLDKATADGYLRIKPVADTTPLPFITVANSGRGTVARIRAGNGPTDPSAVVGEYWTKPGNGGGNPSRTTVDRYGNVWVGNRAVWDDDGGSITQFGLVLGGTRCDENGSPTENGDYLKAPFIYNTCVDRNGDGYIHTSKGLISTLDTQWNWPDSSGAEAALDEAILRYVRAAPYFVRTLVVDRDNNLWAGSRESGNQWHEYIDAEAGMPVTGRRVRWAGGGYGGVVGRDGAIWSADTFGTRALLRFKPDPGIPVARSGGTIRNTERNYGIGVDPRTGDVWQSFNAAGTGTPDNFVMQFRADHCATRFSTDQSPGRGIVIDGRGSVWVGGSGSGTGAKVFHLTTAGASVGSVPIMFTPPGQPNPVTVTEPMGVAVDHLAARLKTPRKV